MESTPGAFSDCKGWEDGEDRENDGVNLHFGFLG